MAGRLGDEELLKRLRAHPEMRERLERTLLAVADEEGELSDADAAEPRLIADPMEERLGQNGRCLLDFFHVCGYLDAAAQAIAPTGKDAQAGMETQKDRLKHGQAPSVLETLEPYQENQRIEDDPAPRRVAAHPQRRAHVGLTLESRQPPLARLLEKSLTGTA
jgi:hypothetical protein